MIKINLLLARKEKKKVGLRKEIVVLIACVAILFAGLMVFQWRLDKEKEDTLSKISETKKEIAYYKSLTTEVVKAREAQRILQDKLNVINTLRKEKAGAAKVLDELSIDKPEKLHLESLKKDGSKLGIED